METQLANRVGNVELHPGQYALLASRNPITLVVAGIRGGKTHGGALKMILHAMENPCGADEYHFVCSPTYLMSNVPVEKIFRLLYDKTIFPLCPLVKYQKSQRVFILRTLSGGITKIRVFSLHEPQRLRGFKALSLWIDEAAYADRDAWKVAQGRVADTGGPIWITTTPAGYNWVYDEYERAIKEKRKGIALHERTVRVIQFSSLDNRFIEDKSGFERLLASYDELTYQQEVLAKFIKTSGLVYYPFRRIVHTAQGEIDPSKPLWIGQDFNVDPMATMVGQPFTNRDGKDGVHFKYERKAANSDTFKLVAWLDQFCQEHQISKSKVVIYPDANGKARSTSGKSDFYILKNAGYRVDAPLANPFIKDRVNCVNGLLAPVKGMPRFAIDPRCVNAIEALEKQLYEEGTDPPVPDKAGGFDHLMDAMGYQCWRRFPLRGKMSLGGNSDTQKAA